VPELVTALRNAVNLLVSKNPAILFSTCVETEGARLERLGRHKMSNPIYPADDILTHGLALVPALTSITSKQVGAITDIACASGQEWDIQTADDYDGYRFILLETVGHGDDRKSLFVAGTAQRLELFEGKDEGLTLIGTFTDMKVLEASLAGLIRLQ